MTDQPHTYCCEMMQTNLAFDCSVHESVYDCADSLVVYTAKFDEYGLIIHDGGSSYILISYCPWCGHKLPESKRNEYFALFDQLEMELDSES